MALRYQLPTLIGRPAFALIPLYRNKRCRSIRYCPHFLRVSEVNCSQIGVWVANRPIVHMKRHPNRFFHHGNKSHD